MSLKIHKFQQRPGLCWTNDSYVYLYTMFDEEIRLASTGTYDYCDVCDQLEDSYMFGFWNENKSNSHWTIYCTKHCDKIAVKKQHCALCNKNVVIKDKVIPLCMNCIKYIISNCQLLDA